MTEEAKIARREYVKRWKQAHPDRVKEHNARYWEKYAAKKKAESIAKTIDIIDDPA